MMKKKTKRQKLGLTSFLKTTTAQGASVAEYGILLSLIGLVSVTVVLNFGGTINGVFGAVDENLTSVNNGTVGQETSQSGAEPLVPQRVATLTDGTQFLAYDCLIGTPGFDTDENDLAFSARFAEADCFDGLGGDTEIEIDETAGPDMLFYVYPDMEEAEFYAGAHWLDTSNLQAGSGTASIDAVAAGAVVDFSWLNQADATFSGIRETLTITPNSGAALDVGSALEDPDIIRIGFADAVITVGDLVPQITQFQGSDSVRDTIYATWLADTIRTGTAGANVFTYRGEDVIYIEGTNSSLYGDVGYGEKTVHLPGVNFTDVTARDSGWTTYYIDIDTGSGTDTVQVAARNVFTTYVFDDGTRTEAEILALIP